MFNILKRNGFVAYADGVLKKVDESNDPVFSERMLGDGIIITPTSNIVVSPIKGTVTMMFPTKHAVGLKDINGNEYLLHIGIDTVNLKGKYFKNLVQENSIVEVNQPIMEVEFSEIEKLVKSIDVICVFTDGRKVKKIKEGIVKRGEKDIVTLSK